ncbi:MAG: ATP-binding protein [Gammaproteobacteria bacterium]
MNSKLVSLKRKLKLDLPSGQSAFLWGARKTGKSTYLGENFPHAIYYDLLKTDQFTKLLHQPHLLREEVLALKAENQLIILDEVQKNPLLLDEVHWLIENTSHQFILCGSSARQLRRAGVNLLGGRAWKFNFFPLVYPEIPNFDLLHALNYGLLPSHYRQTQAKKSLDAYVGIYLKEEIQAEGLVRNLPAFSKFLEIASLCNGELINYSNIAQDCGVDSKTVKQYFDILTDTYVGYLIEPYSIRKKRDIITKAHKFYFFDTGVSNRLARQHFETLSGMAAGKSFEHWILMELIAYKSLEDKDQQISFWRSKTGLEVDFVVESDLALEVKISPLPKPTDLKGLYAFCEEHSVKHAVVVCTAEKPRLLTKGPCPIMVLPWQEFLENLWSGYYF